MDELLSKYVEGDQVLFRQTILGRQAESLEPAQITSFALNSVTLRQFARCARDLGDDKAKPNQVAFTDDLYHAAPSQIVRRCYVRLFPDTASISAPFNRDGAGDFFFIIPDRVPHSLLSIPTLRHEPLPAESIQPSNKLKGLGLFCGGGNFDRGIEEGGAVDFQWAVEWAKCAMHTYRANLPDPDATQLFLGSVNDYPARANCGSQDKRIAKVGDVEFIAAGSPCPGFSRLQLAKQSPESLRNCSLVAAVMSHVDLYTPDYMILENVTGLADHPTDKPELNVFSQTLCCLVAMGYQVQQHLIDPISYGSCQSRARIFIIASAPGCVPINAPPHTHESVLYKSIGKMSNGLQFGGRRGDISPYKAVSARQAIGDLLDISDSHVQTCIQFPDHRTTRSENSLTHGLISMVPRWPHGLGFVQTVNMRNDQAINRTPMGKRQIETAPWQNKHKASPRSRAWSRIPPDGRIGCLTTVVMPNDAFCGHVLHWDQPRLLTVMEARRTQGFLDDEVVIGIPTAQWKIIGNSVDRKVAFALGLSLGKAWQQTLEDRGSGQAMVTTATKRPLKHALLGERVQHSTEEAHETSSRIANLDLSSSIRSRNATRGPHAITALAAHITASRPEDVRTKKSIKRSRRHYDYDSDCFIVESTDTDAAADSQSSTIQENEQDEDSDCIIVGGMTRGGASTQASTEPSPEPRKRKYNGEYISEQWQSDSNGSNKSHGSRSSNKKYLKQATRRAVGDGLIVPNDWARKVERSGPWKPRMVQD
ncbi:S-adenosyl-L-methionine-dependent methyltransferase [Delphinella strobiligena]|nr:S-adenosyl-L-methionine-dependent methyltransferase [Delphinella strobiligena]